MVTHPGNRIYHYCRLSTALEHILPAQRLLLGPLVNTNDPRENKSYIFAGSSTKTIPVRRIEDINKEVSDILRSDCKTICFSKDDKYFGFEYSRMWAYYSDNHKGLCLELDAKEFLLENEPLINRDLFRKIAYFEFNYQWIEHKVIDHDAIEKMGRERYLREIFRPEHLDYLYFTKNKEWESEQETRLLHYSDKKENEYCSIKKSLRNIFCGVDFNDSYFPAIASVCPHIDITKLRYGDVRLVPGKVIPARTP
jgi:hypothetical protein